MKSKKKIILVFKTHFDIGYTHLVSEALDNFISKMLPDVIKTCEETKELNEKSYVWTVPAWPLFYAVNSKHLNPDIKTKLNELIKSKKIVWHALPFTTHTEFCGLEEYIRGMYFSKELEERSGYSVISAKMTDVPGHTWILPSLLAAAGIKFLHLGCNPCSMPPDVPYMFFWEGPDGNRVLTIYSKGSYGTSLIPPEEWDFPVWLALMQTNDNVGPQDTQEVLGLLEKIKSASPEADVIIGTMDDFYNEIIKYDLSNVPVVKKDLADSWIHGIGTYPNEVGRLRELRRIITETEKLLSFGHLLGAVDENFMDSKTYIEKAYEQGILFGEHTWGLDVKKTLGHDRHYEKKEFEEDRKSEAYLRIEESWNEQRKRVDSIEQLLIKIKSNAESILSWNIRTDCEKITVFNGLGWERDAILDLSDYKDKIGNKSLIDAQTEKQVELISSGEQLSAFVKEISAFGYKTLLFSENRVKKETAGTAGSKIIENDYYRIEADPKQGRIKSIYDKKNEKQWVDNNHRDGFCQYRYDVYGIDDITEYIRSYTYRFSDWIVKDLGRLSYPEIEHKTYISKEWEIKTGTSSMCDTLYMQSIIKDESTKRFGNAQHLKMKITIYKSNPYIDIELKMKNKQESPIVEAGHFVFPLSLSNPKIIINKLGSMVDPSKDIIENANNSLYCCENWVDFSDEKVGISIIPYDTPLFSIDRQKIYEFEHKYKASNSLVYFNLFNNQWGTNFPQWLGGDYTFRYRLIPHRGNFADAGIHRKSLEALTPLLHGYSTKVEAETIALPICYDFINKTDDLEILTLKPAEKNKGLIIRLREIHGRSGNLKIIFNINFSAVWKCDLLEKELSLMAENTNELNIYSSPNQIHTFKLLTQKDKV